MRTYGFKGHKCRIMLGYQPIPNTINLTIRQDEDNRILWTTKDLRDPLRFNLQSANEITSQLAKCPIPQPIERSIINDASVHGVNLDIICRR